jgi:hypothetical protein
MTPLKFIAYALFILAMGICASVALFDATARTQEQREASFQAKADRCRVGQYCTIGGHGFLKMSEAEERRAGR